MMYGRDPVSPVERAFELDDSHEVYSGDREWVKVLCAGLQSAYTTALKQQLENDERSILRRTNRRVQVKYGNDDKVYLWEDVTPLMVDRRKMKKLPHKLAYRWSGPHRVVEMRGLNLVRIDHARRGEETHNVNRLALCRPWNQEHFSTHEELPDGDDNDDADIVGEDKPKFDTRMDREPKVGELLLIKLKPPTKKTRVGTEEFCPFGIVRFKGIDQGYYGFQ
jgi:hypothetical protein